MKVYEIDGHFDVIAVIRETNGLQSGSNLFQISERKTVVEHFLNPVVERYFRIMMICRFS